MNLDAGQSISLAQVTAFMNEIDPLVGKLSTLADLSPLVECAPADDKGRVALGLLEIVEDYVNKLAGRLALFATRLPRANLVSELDRQEGRTDYE